MTSNLFLFLTTSQAVHLHNLISLQPLHSTRGSSSVITLSRSPTISSLKITDRSFRDASHHVVFEISFPIHFISLASHVSIHLLIHLSTHPSHHPPLLHSRLKNLPVQQILPTLIDFFYLPDCLHDNGTGPDLSYSSV